MPTYKETSLYPLDKTSSNVEWKFSSGPIPTFHRDVFLSRRYCNNSLFRCNVALILDARGTFIQRRFVKGQPEHIHLRSNQDYFRRLVRKQRCMDDRLSIGYKPVHLSHIIPGIRITKRANIQITASQIMVHDPNMLHNNRHV